jgi:hypothetical protein
VMVRQAWFGKTQRQLLGAHAPIPGR